MVEEEKKKKKVSSLLTLGIVILMVLAVVIINNLNQEPESTPLTKADVQLYKFDNLKNSVEIWLKNIGEETATNINLTCVRLVGL